jgi:hypothetical protein
VLDWKESRKFANTFGTCLVHVWCTFGTRLVHVWYTFQKEIIKKKTQTLVYTENNGKQVLNDP